MPLIAIMGKVLHAHFGSVEALLSFMSSQARRKLVTIPGHEGRQYCIQTDRFSIEAACKMAGITQETLSQWMEKGFRIATGGKKVPRLPDVARCCLMKELVVGGMAVEAAIPASARIVLKLLPHIWRSPHGHLLVDEEGESGRFRKSRASVELVDLFLTHYLKGPYPRFAIVQFAGGGNIQYSDDASCIDANAELVLDLNALGDRIADLVEKPLATIVVPRVRSGSGDGNATANASPGAASSVVYWVDAPGQEPIEKRVRRAARARSGNAK